MITEYEYLKAKKIVVEYENQQRIKLERFESGDLDLLTVLSAKSRNFLINNNESPYTKDGEELIYISDVVKLIKKSGCEYEL